MAALSRGGWLSFFQKLTPPSPDSDADLLDRFLRDRCETALDILIRRYAGMVLGVCRRRLGDSPDADDAFQATFLVLVKNASNIARGASLPAWLHRVAYLTSLKLAGQRHRRGTAPMNSEPVDRGMDPPESIAAKQEIAAILDEELAALPEAFRGPVVLCCLEGKTNVEAAGLLGIPVGTVDSRLHAAREKLRRQLIKRGLTGSVLGLTFTAGVTASDDLIRSTVKTAMGFALGGEIASPFISTLTIEVTKAMSQSPFKLIAAAMMVSLLAGGIGTGVYFAQAGDDPPKPVSNANTLAVPTKKDEAKPTKPVNLTEVVETQTGKSKSVKEIMGYLMQPFRLERRPGITVGQLFDLISKEYDIVVRIEDKTLLPIGMEGMRDKLIEFDFDPRKVTLKDILDEIILQIDFSRSQIGYRVMNNQIVFSRRYSAKEIVRDQPSLYDESSYKDVVSVISPKVSFQFNELTLEEICNQLRDLTACNIVLDQNNKNMNKQKISLTLNSTDLFTALDMASYPCGMATTLKGNVYFITDAKDAEKMNRENAIALFGEKKPSLVYVPVNREGKFVPPGPEGFQGQKFQFVPVLVEEPKANTPVKGQEGKKNETPEPG